MFKSSVYFSIRLCDGCVFNANHCSSFGTSVTGSMKVRFRLRRSSFDILDKFRPLGFISAFGGIPAAAAAAAALSTVELTPEQEKEQKEKLICAVLYCVLAPYDNEQSDMMAHLSKKKKLENIPAYRLVSGKKN